MRYLLIAALACAAAGVGSETTAQSKLTRTFATLTTEAALTAAQAALARCDKDGYTVAVAVVDRAGVPLVVLRDNLAGAHTPQTAINKASTALSFRTDTSELAKSTEPGRPSSGVRLLPNVVAVAGGVQVSAKGSLVGAIGVSGAPGGDNDETCAKAGVAAISDALELE